MRFLSDPDEVSVLKIGDKAPDFALETDLKSEWRLSEQFGNVTALLFYPQNETLVCTRQMCSVRDNWASYVETKASIVAVSPGTAEEHRRFAARHRLPLPILADAERLVTKLFCEHWLLPIQLVRGVIVIDARGFVRCRQVTARLFRPADRSVIAAIRAARGDFHNEHFTHLLEETRARNRDCL